MKYLLPLLLALLLSSGVAAQTPTAIAGLEVIAERQYASETETTIVSTESGVFLVSARVYMLETKDDTEPVWAALVDAEAITTDLGENADDTLVREEITDMGDRAMALNISFDLDVNETAEFRMVVTQHDSMIVTVSVIANSPEAAAIADDIAGAMIVRDIGTAPSVYNGVGTSSGGVWEVFLPPDSPELIGLTAYLDKETRPAS